MNPLTLEAASIKEFNQDDAPLGLFAFEGNGVAAPFLSSKTKKEINAELSDAGFKGNPGEKAAFRASDGNRSRRFIVIGLGGKKGFTADCQRKAASALYNAARKGKETMWISIPGDRQAAVEGFLLSAHTDPRYKEPCKDTKLQSVKVITQSAGEKKKTAAAIERAGLFSEAVCWTRDLVNEAPSDQSPERLTQTAKKYISDGVTLKIIDKKQAAKLGMGSYLSVARGSDAPPYFLHFIYKPKGKAKKKIGLVGKGVTFDSGGLSLKPAGSMETMKCDMAGAATVFGVMRVLSRLKVKAEVHGITPLTYNMPGPDATKPGDIVRASNGKTIEILNTDAEGRLILADALVYASKLKFDVIMDLATLTGAAVVALGNDVTAAMTNDKSALQKLLASSKKTQEMVWELPLVKGYKKQIKSKVANIKNIGNRGEAGTITAGLFLEEFVDAKSWIHLDIAGPAWTDGGQAYCPPGGTGAMVRTLLEYLSAL
ncbi:MAG: leucyl aminopeptidase [Elusimicrobia bacterium]|nr:MAG: leucyl aminopeptidase [Elusimicrobiota bacterium]